LPGTGHSTLIARIKDNTDGVVLWFWTAAAHESTISAEYADIIVSSRRTASTQIAIAPRPA